VVEVDEELRILCSRTGPWLPQGPIVVVERGSAHLAAEHSILMTQHDDLEVLPVSGTHREASELGEESVQKTRHEGQGWRHRPWSAGTRQFLGTTGYDAVMSEEELLGALEQEDDPKSRRHPGEGQP